MNAAQRAEALVAGNPAECPRCDAILEVKRDGYGTSVSYGVCGYTSSVALACVAGKKGDPTAAVWVLDWSPGFGA